MMRQVVQTPCLEFWGCLSIGNQFSARHRSSRLASPKNPMVGCKFDSIEMQFFLLFFYFPTGLDCGKADNVDATLPLNPSPYIRD